MHREILFNHSNLKFSGWRSSGLDWGKLLWQVQHALSSSVEMTFAEVGTGVKVYLLYIWRHIMSF